MKSQANRLARLERVGGSQERQFLAWLGNPWTDEEKAKAVRDHPERLIHAKPMLPSQNGEIERKRE
jgi:hypothetical protein